MDFHPFYWVGVIRECSSSSILLSLSLSLSLHSWKISAVFVIFALKYTEYTVPLHGLPSLWELIVQTSVADVHIQ